MSDHGPRFEVTLYHDQPIIIVTGYHIPGRAGPVIEAMGVALDEQLTALGHPAYVIFDFATLKITLRQMLESMATTTRGGPTGTLRDRRIIQSVFVSTNPILEKSSKAFGQNQFGGLRIPNFATLDEALTYVQGRLADAE